MSFAMAPRSLQGIHPSLMRDDASLLQSVQSRPRHRGRHRHRVKEKGQVRKNRRRLRRRGRKNKKKKGRINVPMSQPKENDLEKTRSQLLLRYEQRGCVSRGLVPIKIVPRSDEIPTDCFLSLAWVTNILWISSFETDDCLSLVSADLVVLFNPSVGRLVLVGPCQTSPLAMQSLISNDSSVPLLHYILSVCLYPSWRWQLTLRLQFAQCMAHSSFISKTAFPLTIYLQIYILINALYIDQILITCIVSCCTYSIMFTIF